MTAALNERFRQQAAREALQNSLTAALAGTEPEASLPTVEARLRALQERQNELLRLVMSAGVDCTDYDEELQRINEAKAALTAKQAELERENHTASAFDSRMAELTGALESAGGALSGFDEVAVRQLVSSIRALDKDRLLIRFKDGTELEQTVEHLRTARVS